jgi:hypothetical protein
MPTKDKPVTIRIAEDKLRDLMALSVVDNGNLADQVRRAVDEYVTSRVSSPSFNEQVRAAHERQTSVLESLTRG